MESKYCPWCMNKNRKTELEFSVIDDMAGQYMHPNKIKYCVVCGRELYSEKEEAKGGRMNNENRGLYQKYIVLKADTGKEVVDCFILRPKKDPAAVAALREYARVTDNKNLANDILLWIEAVKEEAWNKRYGNGMDKRQ